MSLETNHCTMIYIYNAVVYCIWNILTGHPIRFPTMTRTTHKVPDQMSIMLDASVYEHIPVVKHEHVKATISADTYVKLRNFILDKLPVGVYAHIFKGMYRNQHHEMVKNICAEFNVDQLNELCNNVLQTVCGNIQVVIPANVLDGTWDDRDLDVCRFNKYYGTTVAAYYDALARHVITSGFILKIAMGKTNAVRGRNFLKAIGAHQLPFKLPVVYLDCTWLTTELFPHVVLTLDEWRTDDMDGPCFKKIITLDEEIKSTDGKQFTGKYIADGLADGQPSDHSFNNWIDILPDCFDEDGDVMLVVRSEFTIGDSKFQIQLDGQNYTLG